MYPRHTFAQCSKDLESRASPARIAMSSPNLTWFVGIPLCFEIHKTQHKHVHEIHKTHTHIHIHKHAHVAVGSERGMSAIRFGIFVRKVRTVCSFPREGHFFLSFMKKNLKAHMEWVPPGQILMRSPLRWEPRRRLRGPALLLARPILFLPNKETSWSLNKTGKDLLSNKGVHLSPHPHLFDQHQRWAALPFRIFSRYKTSPVIGCFRST